MIFLRMMGFVFRIRENMKFYAYVLLSVLALGMISQSLDLGRV